MDKKNKIILFVVIILLLLFGGFFLLSHKSVDKKKDNLDLKIQDQLSQIEENSEVLNTEVEPENSNLKITEEIVETENVVEEKTETKLDLEILSSGIFDENAKDSDSFHKASGGVKIIETQGIKRLVFDEDFKVSNAPDLYIYLVPETNVETEDKFNSVKSNSVQLTQLKQFSGFSSYDISDDVDLDNYKGVVIWCEQFSQFMSYADLE